MKAYEVSGQFMISHRKWQPFTIEVAAADESGAREKTLALMGSRHGLKRRSVRIDDVKSLKAEEISDHVVKHLVEAKK
jgi:ribosomal protein L20A (L18A)